MKKLHIALLAVLGVAGCESSLASNTQPSISAAGIVIGPNDSGPVLIPGGDGGLWVLRHQPRIGNGQLEVRRCYPIAQKVGAQDFMCNQPKDYKY